MKRRPVRAMTMAGVFLALSLAGSEGALVTFNQVEYTIGLNDLLEVGVEIVYEAAPDPGDESLFSYGVRLLPEAGSPVVVGGVEPVTALDFNGVLGSPALVDTGPDLLGVKGTVDLFAGPTEPYAGSLLATFGLRFLDPGVYDLDLAFFNTLGPTEEIFVTGDGSNLDPFISFGSARVTVIPEPSGALLVLLGLAGLVLRRRRG